MPKQSSLRTNPPKLTSEGTDREIVKETHSKVSDQCQHINSSELTLVYIFFSNIKKILKNVMCLVVILLLGLALVKIYFILNYKQFFLDLLNN